MEDLNFSGHSGGRSPTLKDLLAIGFRHRRLIVLSFLGVFLGAIVTAALQTNQYDSEMKILVKRDRVEPVVTPQANTVLAQSPEVSEAELNSEVELLKSRELLEKTVLACGLQYQNDSAQSKMLAALGVHMEAQKSADGVQVANAVRRLEKELKIETIKKTNLIAMGYRSSDPQLSARVLNTLANLYLEKHVAVHRPSGALDFFQQETQRYREDLAEAQARLVNFRREAAVVSAPLEKTVAIQKLSEFESSLKQTEATISETQQRIQMLQKEAASTPTRVVTQVRNSDDAVLLSQLRSNLLTLEQKRTELLGKFEPGYRLVQEVDAQITQTRAALASAEKSQLHDETTDRDPTHELVAQELSKAQADLAGLQARGKAISLAVQSYQGSARSLEEKEIVEDDLLRAVKAAEENYLLYVRKEEEARISNALDRGRILNVVIAEPASVPSLPSNQRSLRVIFGFLIATFVSFGFAFASERMDSTFRTPDEVESILEIPVLAAMPRGSRR